MSRPARLIIDLGALKHNLGRVRALAPNAAIMAMVKANAYGHGILPVAQALTEADALGVACLEEAGVLREAGVRQPIVLMEGLFHPDELPDAVRYQVALVLHHMPQIEMLEAASGIPPFQVWLKLNTGMCRLGIEPSEVLAVYQRLQAANTVKKPIGLMTHFALADNCDSQTTSEQQRLFLEITQGLTGPRSLANSAAILAWPETHADWVRPGLMLYGASPFPNQAGIQHDLRPVMTLSSQLIAVNRVPQGAKVGYGGTWLAPETMSVGVVGAGYGDGYPQFAPNGAPVLVNGEVCPLVGRVSMDMLTVDLRAQPNAKPGDPVLLWGEDLPVERVAEATHTSAYELLARMTVRPAREWRV
ncbi:MAG: alanine racemase [Gammaproteobacteria bacterium RIFCSPHIGHO2_12_FULL_45_12]|nr:MAG: alanine racemase [Gammaproteobacteria bacterium RIFCSPHIGHO2_12_FULL_45_12]